jgi:hypothetical protein
MNPGKGKSYQQLICKSCHLYQKPQSHLYDDPGRCALGRILPTKKNACGIYLEIQSEHEKDYNIVPARWGGFRPGSGRPKLKNKKQVYAFSLSPQVVDFIDQYSRINKLSKSQAVESIIKSCI